MFRVFLIICLYFNPPYQTLAEGIRPDATSTRSTTLTIPPRFLERAKKKEIVTSISVTSDSNKNQKLSYKALGIHPQSCTSCLRILQRYENFSRYLDFLKESQYNDAINELYLIFSSPILPSELNLRFKIHRTISIGDYPFLFPTGIFPGLKGNIHIEAFPKDKCLFYVTADWEGKESSISSGVLELFLITVTKYGMERLFRISTL